MSAMTARSNQGTKLLVRTGGMSTTE
jgi:hypothetical protein